MSTYGSFKSAEATHVEYLYLTEAGLNQLGFESDPSLGFEGSIDNFSVQEVGIISLGTHPALNISALQSPTLATTLTITATTVNAVFGQWSGDGFQGTVVEYLLIPQSGLSQFGFEASPGAGGGASGFNGSIDNFSIQEVGILTLTFHPGLVINSAFSQTFTTNANVSPKFNLSVNGAVSGGVVSVANLNQNYRLFIDDLFSTSIMTEASVASSVNVALANFRKVYLRWLDRRFPAVHLGPRELGGFQP